MNLINRKNIDKLLLDIKLILRHAWISNTIVRFLPDSNLIKVKPFDNDKCLLIKYELSAFGLSSEVKSGYVILDATSRSTLNSEGLLKI
jgi:hypothetical protein